MVILALAGSFNFSPTIAQIAQQDGAIEDMLEAILENQEFGVQRGGGIGGVGEQPMLPVVGADPNGELRETSGLSAEQMVIVQRFCEGRLEGDQLDLLALVPDFSPLEQDYCKRAGMALLQFGYDVFDGFSTPEVDVNGAIPDDYRLGVGDQIVITYRGQVSKAVQAVVDREGRIILDDFTPIAAAGRSFGEFRREVEARVEAAFVGTEVFVSLGAVRAVAVSVTGEVRSPGVHQLSGLSTIYDAVAQAGGIKKTGSLRRLVVHRDGASFELDVYDLLTGGPIPRQVVLLGGDRIVVPSVGPTVAVAGKVIRPAIYELREGQGQVTLEEILSRAGGTLRPSGLRIALVTFDEAGRVIVLEAEDRAELVRAGDLIDVGYGEDIEVGTVSLDGHVRDPGRRARAQAASVRVLVGAPENLMPGAYLPFAILETLDAATHALRHFPVNLQRILDGEIDYALKDHDRLIVLGIEDVRFLSDDSVQEQIRSSLQPSSAGLQDNIPVVAQRIINELKADLDEAERQLKLLGERGLKQGPEIVDEAQEPCRAIKVLSDVLQLAPNRFSGTVLANVPGAPNMDVDIAQTGQINCPDTFVADPYILPLLLEHTVMLSGEVRNPGLYPVTTDTRVVALASVAGGVTRKADLTRIEITRFTLDPATGTSKTIRGFADLSGQQGVAVLVGPGDVIRFNPVITDRDMGPVLLAGELARPGQYNIRRGETLSELLTRAGGLTAEAYPYGAVFTRESVKRVEREGFVRAARELDAAAVSAAARQDLGADVVAAMRQITSEIAAAEPVGRVIIEADPTVLQVRPDLDLVLQPGDTLFIPKRPSSVLVIGDVLNPGAQQFLPGMRAERYIEQAGGFQQSADQDRVYLVYPDGVAEPVNLSVWNWNYSNAQIPPGSTIVAPKDPAPFDLLRLTSEVASVVSQIAVTLASLAVITD